MMPLPSTSLVQVRRRKLALGAEKEVLKAESLRPVQNGTLNYSLLQATQGRQMPHNFRKFETF